MSTRMWVFETDKYGPTARKFSVDNPSFIPRIGEFIDNTEASGWVSHVQYTFNRSTTFDTIVNVYLSGEKQKEGE